MCGYLCVSWYVYIYILTHGYRNDTESGNLWVELNYFLSFEIDENECTFDVLSHKVGEVMSRYGGGV